MAEMLLGPVTIAVIIVAAALILPGMARRPTPTAYGAAGPFTGRTGGRPRGGVAHAVARGPGGGPRGRTPHPDPGDWQSTAVSDLSAAEDLLDLAEAEGYQERELVVLGNSSFLVRWRGRN
jgi:hypothetical protein